MAWVKSNFKWKARDVDFDTIGQNFKNWIAGSFVEPDVPHGGGLVMMSFASQLSGVGFLQISAAEFIYSTYGATLASNLLLAGAGFKVVPVAFQDFSGVEATSPAFYRLSATMALAGDNSIAVVAVFRVTTTAAGSGGGQLALTLASNASVHFIAQGWIVSSPQALK